MSFGKCPPFGQVVGSSEGAAQAPRIMVHEGRVRGVLTKIGFRFLCGSVGCEGVKELFHL